jgi:hypothetical protein
MSLALDLARTRAPAEDSLKSEYLRALRLVERLHRLLLDVIKDEFDRLGGAELNSVQALLLYNAPVWQPARLQDVSRSMLDAYFAPLGPEELQLASRSEMQAVRT